MTEPHKGAPTPGLTISNPGELLHKFLKEDADRRARERAAKPDLWTGKKVCARFKIPAHFLAPKQAKPGELVKPPKQGEVELELHLQMGYSNCIGSACQMWDADNKQCHEVTQSQSFSRIADLIELIDGFMRIPSTGGHD